MSQPIDAAFWVVWCPGTGHPKKRHESEVSAEAEARRLAEVNPSQEFYVLRAEHLFRNVTTQHIKLIDVPF